MAPEGGGIRGACAHTMVKLLPGPDPLAQVNMDFHWSFYYEKCPLTPVTLKKLPTARNPPQDAAYHNSSAFPFKDTLCPGLCKANIQEFKHSSKANRAGSQAVFQPSGTPSMSRRKVLLMQNLLCDPLSEHNIVKGLPVAEALIGMIPIACKTTLPWHKLP